MWPCPTESEIWFLDSQFDYSLFSSSYLCLSSKDLYWESTLLPLKLLASSMVRSFSFYALPPTDIRRQMSRCLVIWDLPCCPSLSCGPTRQKHCFLPSPLNSSSLQYNTIRSQFFIVAIYIKNMFCRRIISSWFSSRLFFTLRFPLWTLYPLKRLALRGVGSR